MGDGLQKYVREDAYFKIFKAFAAGKHDLTKELLLSRLRKELEITDERHSSLRQMVMDGNMLQQRDYEAAVAPKKASKPAKARPQKRERVRTPEISDDDDEVEYKAVKRSNSRPVEASTRPVRPNKRPSSLEAQGAGMDGLEINHLIGNKVQRYWPEYGGWWDGVITDYKNGEHCIVYDLNTPKESYEWYDISIARADEFRVSDEKINILEHRPKPQPGNAMGNGVQKPNGLHAGRGHGSSHARSSQTGHHHHNPSGGAQNGSIKPAVGNERNAGSRAPTPPAPFVVDSESESTTTDSDSDS